MIFTQAKVYPYSKKKRNGEVGIGQIVLDNCILLTGLRLMERNGKRFILYPINYKNKRQLCFVQPINRDVAASICDALFENYAQVKNNTPVDVNMEEDAFTAGIQDMVNAYNDEVGMKNAIAALQNGPQSNGPDPVDINQEEREYETIEDA